MGLFSTKKPAGPGAGEAVARMGSGRKLRSGSDAAGCRATLEAVVEIYRPRRYAALPHVVDSGYRWTGPGRPEIVVSCTDERDDFLLVTMCRGAAGTELGVFPLGSGDQRLTLPIIGHWKAKDSSLASIGTYPADTVALRAPRVPADYAAEILAAAGRPATPGNLRSLRDTLVQQFLIKAQQFIGSQQPARAHEFAARHRDRDDLQAILDELGAWNTGVLPYVQDLPARIRALLLEPEFLRTGKLWTGMEG